MRGQASSYKGLGECYHWMGQHIEAIELYNKSRIIREEVGDLKGLGTVYGCLGASRLSLYERVEQNAGSHDDRRELMFKAMQNFKEELFIGKKVGDRKEQAAAYSGIGSCHRAESQYHKAIQQYNLSLTIQKEVGDRTGEAVMYHSLAECLVSLGQDTEARGVTYNEGGDVQRALAVMYRAVMYNELWR